MSTEMSNAEYRTVREFDSKSSFFRRLFELEYSPDDESDSDCDSYHDSVCHDEHTELKCRAENELIHYDLTRQDEDDETVWNRWITQYNGLITGPYSWYIKSHIYITSSYPPTYEEMVKQIELRSLPLTDICGKNIELQNGLVNAIFEQNGNWNRVDNIEYPFMMEIPNNLYESKRYYVTGDEILDIGVDHVRSNWKSFGLKGIINWVVNQDVMRLV